MAGTNPDLVVRVAANIAALTSDMAAASASVKNIESAISSAHAAGQGWMASLDGLGHSWVARIAEGELLRDAVREVVEKMKELVEYFPELAIRGSVVGDVEESFKHLAEQAGHTSEVLLGTLRAGTHGTVDDFALMQRANKDLAAGLELTDTQMGVLAQGAFALAKATGTDTKNALDTMSDAMVTGKAKAVALLTGKIDLKAAEDAFAASLGATKDELTAEGKLEADRQAILAGVERGLARVGEQHDSLKDKVDQTHAAWENFEDDLGKTIAQSPVLAAGIDSVRASLLAAYGGNQKALIDGIASAVTNAAIVVVDFGIALGLMAGVAVQLWNGIKTAVLAVETGIVGLVTGIGEVLLAADKMANKLHLVDDSEVAKIQATQDALRGMTVGLAAETAEAARAAAGHSELGTAIDRGNGILLTARDAMIAAQDAQKEQTAATTAFVGPLQEASEAVKTHGDYLHQTAAQAKELAKLEAAALLETTKLWDEYNALRVQHSGTATDVQVAQIDKWAADLTAKMQAAGTDTADFYDALEAVSAEKMAAVGSHWPALVAVSRESLDQIAARAWKDYDDMVNSSLHFSRAAIQAQRDVAQAAQDAARDWQSAAEGAAAGTDTWREATDAWNASVMNGAEAVQSLAGAWISAAEAKKQYDMGNTLDLGHAAQDPRIMAFLKAGWSLANAEALKQGEDWHFTPKLFDPLGNPENLPSKGERVPGYITGVENAPGGWAMVGEAGPELMRVPRGADIYPTGTGPGGTQTINLVVDGRVLASVVADHTMQRQRNIGVRF